MIRYLKWRPFTGQKVKIVWRYVEFDALLVSYNSYIKSWISEIPVGLFIEVS